LLVLPLILDLVMLAPRQEQSCKKYLENMEN